MIADADRERLGCHALIVLFTDFGPSGPYVGQVKAVLARDAPGVPVIDLFSDAPSRNPKAAAYLLAAYGTWFPPETVFVAVVDPGVGGARKPVIIEADDCCFVGPDNGLFELVIRRARQVRGWKITWRPPSLSASFHGRDLFAPVAARLARGDEIATLARETQSVRFGAWPDDLPEIIYVDYFGNAMTGMRAASLNKEARLLVAGRWLSRAATFADVPSGTAFWYENSNGLAEIALNQGRADAALWLTIGSPVEITGVRRPKIPTVPKAAMKPDKPRPGHPANLLPKVANPRLTEQTRKVLGKHYANKYRVK